MAAALLSVPAAAPGAYEDEEARNYTKTHERARFEHMQPDYRALLYSQSLKNLAELEAIRLRDPERSPSNFCASQMEGCAGDVRLYDWDHAGFGLSHPVLFTARSGATLSGHVWATTRGPAKRPGVVLTTGSVQAPEVLYLFAAQTLAQRGYVVLTYDVQGQGRSDTYGEGADRNEGVPAQQLANFTGGTEDALDFLLSTPGSRFRPRPSDSSRTSHADKQDRRVAEARNTPYNPFHAILDPERIGIVGHSLGASAVSEVGQKDPRVDAIVAWDNLRVPQGFPAGAPAPPIRKPALGMSADYPLFGERPRPTPPDPESRNEASRKYSEAGVDTAQINVRGGTHFEWSYIPNPDFGATLRGMDMAAWYTAAWFDRYVKGDPTADRRLLTTRWLNDPRTAQTDPDGDGNLLSRTLRSRIDIGLSGGGRVRCDDLRGAPCAGLVGDDGEPPSYSYLEEARTFESGGNPYNPVTPPSGEVRTPLRGRSPSAASASGGSARPTVGRRLHGSRARGGLVLSLRAPAGTRYVLALRSRSGRLMASGRGVLPDAVRALVLRPRRGVRPGRYVLTARFRWRGGHLSRRLAVRVARSAPSRP